MKKGFTLIELLIVIGMMTILAGFTMPVGMTFYRSQAVEGARSELIETLSRARHNAVLMKGDSRYGVLINPNDPVSGDLISFTLYKGASFDTRTEEDEDYDEVYIQVPNLTISVSGSSDLLEGDINFSKLTGLTTATGTITITHGSGSESRSIFIDNFGKVSATSTSN